MEFHQPQSPSLFADFTEDFHSVRHIITNSPDVASLIRVAAELKKRTYPRDELRLALLEQANYFGSGREALAGIDRLGEPEVSVVLTTLKPNLLGGPLKALLKALTVARMSTELKAEGIDAIPMIWIKERGIPDGEDSIKALDTEMRIIDLHLSAGLEAGLDSLKSDLARALGSGALQRDAFRFFKECFHGAAERIQAWGRWLSGIFADRGIVLIDPNRGKVREIAAGVIQALQELSPEAESLLRQRVELLRAAGYSGIQGSNSVGNGSPLQESMLPILASILEPLEIYQKSLIEPWFPLLDLATPVWWPAASVTVADKKCARFMAKHDLKLSDCFSADSQVIDKILPSADVGAVERNLADAEGLVEDVLSELQLHVGEDSRERLEISGKKMKYQIESLGQKIIAARRRRTTEIEGQLEYVFSLLAPGGKSQEESLGWFYFLLHFGEDLPKFLYNRIDWGRFKHQLLYWE